MSEDAQFTHAHMTRFDWPMTAGRDTVWELPTNIGGVALTLARATARRRPTMSPENAHSP